MQVMSALLPLLALSALVFGPLAGRLALDRQRQPIVWLIFGALLGPIAIALLILAPPGACPRCNEPVAGWPSDCPICGEYLVPPAAARLGRTLGGSQPDRPDLPEPIAIPIRPQAPDFPPQTLSSSHAPIEAPAREHAPSPLDSSSIQPEPGWTARLATLARAPVASQSGAGNSESNGHGTTSSGGTMTTPGGGAPPGSGLSRFSAQTFLPLPGPFDPPTEDPTIVAVGVYVGGTERLTIAARYAIGHAQGRLRVLGPYETNPRKQAIDWDLNGIDIGQGEGQLVLARTDGRRSRVITFRLLSTFNRAVLDAAIVAAGHRPDVQR